jgi:hypothetical protein
VGRTLTCCGTSGALGHPDHPFESNRVDSFHSATGS